MVFPLWSKNFHKNGKILIFCTLFSTTLHMPLFGSLLVGFYDNCIDLLIHSVNPKLRPVGTIVFAHVVHPPIRRVRTYFSNPGNKTKNNVRYWRDYGSGRVVLDHWILCVLYFLKNLGKTFESFSLFGHQSWSPVIHVDARIREVWGEAFWLASFDSISRRLFPIMRRAS